MANPNLQKAMLTSDSDSEFSIVRESKEQSRAHSDTEEVVEKKPKLYSTANSRRTSQISDSQKPTPKQAAGTFSYLIS